MTGRSFPWSVSSAGEPRPSAPSSTRPVRLSPPARRGPSNPNFVSLAEARANVTAALEEALQGIGRCRAAGLALFEPVVPDDGDATDHVLGPLLSRTRPSTATPSTRRPSPRVDPRERRYRRRRRHGSSAVAMRDGKRRVAGRLGRPARRRGERLRHRDVGDPSRHPSSDGAGPSIHSSSAASPRTSGSGVAPSSSRSSFGRRDTGRDRRSVPGHRAGCGHRTRDRCAFRLRRSGPWRGSRWPPAVTSSI